nr:ABC transporter transmembrane domain-containing protein [Octadecabacter dasysiphoniae]
MPAAPTQYANPKAPRAKSRRLGILRALSPFLWPYHAFIALAVVVLLITSALSLALPLAARRVIDSFGTDITAVPNHYFIGALVAAAALAAGSALRFLIIAQLGERVVVDIRKAVFNRVIGMSPAFYEKIMTGEVLSRITTDTTLVQSIIGSSLLMALRNTLMLSGGLILLFLTSAKLASVLLLLGPFLILPVLLIGLKIRVISREAQAWVSASSGKASENLSAVQTVQSFTHEHASRAEFAGFAESSYKAAQRRVRFAALLTLTTMFLIFASVVVVLWIGVADVMAGTMTFGELAQFMIYAVMVASAAAGLSQIWGQLQRAAGATERLVELLHMQDTVNDPTQSTPLDGPIKGQIVFDAVQFTYPTRPNSAALDGVSINIAPGETVALVGPSGAGKSTIIQLVQRFYDPTGGQITLDGHDLRHLERSTFRRAIALVPQDPVIFAATAMENIRFGRPDASDEDVKTAAKAAAAHDFIDAMPDQYHTFLGERGVMLSGGQKQRVAIARAILRDAPILLLDEATSALDAQNEHEVQQAIEKLSQDRTTLIVAHRLATVKKADRIIVLNEGQVVATGTHDELVVSDGLYAHLARLQFTDGAAKS